MVEKSSPDRSGFASNSSRQASIPAPSTLEWPAVVTARKYTKGQVDLCLRERDSHPLVEGYAPGHRGVWRAVSKLIEPHSSRPSDAGRPRFVPLPGDIPEFIRDSYLKTL